MLLPDRLLLLRVHDCELALDVNELLLELVEQLL